MAHTLTRRDFLEKTAAAAAVVALPLPSWQMGNARGRMFISLNGAVAPRVAAWPEMARLAARIGYGGVDWGLAPAKAAGVEATKALFAELKIKPTIVNLPLQTPFAGDDDAFRAKLPQLAEDVAFISAIGCDRMMLVLPATSGLPKDEQRRLVASRLSAVSGVLVGTAQNLRLGLEFLGPLYMHLPTPPAPPANAPPASAVVPAGAAPGVPAGGPARGVPRIPFIWTLPETVQLAKDCGPNVGVVLDIWHWYHSGGTTADILATDVSRIAHVHLSDAKAMAPEDVRDNMRVMPGEGIIDMVGFLQALQKIGYTGGASPEPLGRIPMDMAAEDAAKLGYDTTMAVMKKAGVI